MYTAIVLDKTSQQVLKWAARALFQPEENGFSFETPRGDQLPHHVTLNLGPIGSGLNEPEMLGAIAKVIVDSFVVHPNLGVAAAKVVSMTAGSEEIGSVNDVAHVTLCLKPGVKPVLSNQLFKEKGSKSWSLDEPIELSGSVSEC